MIHRGVEINPIIFRSALNLDFAERLIPDTTTFRFHAVEIPIGNLPPKVISGLVKTDERRADLDLDLFALGRGKSYVTAYTMATLMIAPGMNFVIFPGSRRRKGLLNLMTK